MGAPRALCNQIGPDGVKCDGEHAINVGPVCGSGAAVDTARSGPTWRENLWNTMSGHKGNETCMETAGLPDTRAQVDPKLHPSVLPADQRVLYTMPPGPLLHAGTFQTDT